MPALTQNDEQVWDGWPSQGRGVLHHTVEDGGEVYSPCSGSVGGFGFPAVNRLALHSQGSGCLQPRTPAGAASADAGVGALANSAARAAQNDQKGVRATTAKSGIFLVWVFCRRPQGSFVITERSAHGAWRAGKEGDPPPPHFPHANVRASCVLSTQHAAAGGPPQERPSSPPRSRPASSEQARRASSVGRGIAPAGWRGRRRAERRQLQLLQPPPSA